jgi:pyruvate dehydrogenase E2 component (dihydrolipoamide acetyltransferase)
VLRSSPSIIRKSLLWWLRWPANPWVSVSVACDFSEARAYLEALEREPGPRVTVQALLLAVVGRLLCEIPEANAHVVGGRIERLPSVGALVPVNLLGERRGGQESSIVLIQHMEQRSLRDIAAETSRSVTASRGGQAPDPVVRALTWIAERTPGPILGPALDAADLVSSLPLVSRLLGERIPVATAVSNPGAVFSARDGQSPMTLRGISATLPDRLLHLGTVWGVGAVQDEVLAIDGRPEVRPVLPVTLIADHRIFEGVILGQLVARFAAILRAPAAAFGYDGRRVLGETA